MRLIKPSFEIIEQQAGLEGMYKQIEIAGRTCYKSEDKITEDSAKGFVDRMINAGHCYTGNTELLTENGWIKFRDYNGEKVATVNRDCSFKGFEQPKRIINYSYRGTFYYYPSLGIEVTDGHNMFGIFRESKNDFYNNNSYSLFKCNGNYKDNNGREKTLGERMFKTPRHCLRLKSLNPYGELIGFWLGDGCYSPNTRNKLVFHLKKKRKIEYLKQLCEELGYIFEKRKSNYYTVTNDNIGSSFNSLFYNNGKRISLQYFPSVDIAYSIIEGLINSDGSIGVNTKTVTFSNTSKSIIDWLLIYAPICGYSISDRGVSHLSSSSNPVYKILLLDTDYTINNDSRNKDSKVIITNKTEEVYCVTVSTGLIIVRGTNGVTTICGNCAMLEHGTVYLQIKSRDAENYHLFYHKYSSNPYSYVNVGRGCIWNTLYITTNYRVLVENGWLDDLKYLCEPTEYHEKRVAVHFTLDRATSMEFLRHRKMSFAQESTRYCNYSKDKFGNEVTYILPSWMDEIQLGTHNSTKILIQADGFQEFSANNNQEICEIAFMSTLAQAEINYNTLIRLGWKPQQARAVLPNALKTELVMTGFVEDWKHFFFLRCPVNAHPQARELAIPLRDEFSRKGWL